MTVGAAEASHVKAGKVQGGHILAVAEEVAEAEAQGYHGDIAGRLYKEWHARA